MIMRYKCNICGKLSHTDNCKWCNGNSEMEKINIPYCTKCNVPIFDMNEDGTCKACGSSIENWYKDLVPVFLQEKILLSVITCQDLTNKVIWNLSGNRYLINNKRVVININKIKRSEDILNERKRLEKELDFCKLVDGENDYLKKVVENNRKRFIDIEMEAHNYIINTFNENKNRIGIVSFSGGKDSIIVSDIVRQALGRNDILHVFGDTTLEMEETKTFIESFKRINAQIPFIEVRSDKNFLALCDGIGPPTRLNSWCCSVFKSGPISQALNYLNYDKELKDYKKFLTFYGVRGKESPIRNKYGRTSNSPKITSQKVASPIFGWLDFDVWLYILTRNLEFNYAYRLGYRRVGCWCCPNNSKWSDFLTSIYDSKGYSEWNEYLYSFAKKIGKKDFKNYIDKGFWKARHGGIGLNNDYTKIIRTDCIDKDYENIILQKPYSRQLCEFLKPFGNIRINDDGNSTKIDIYNNKTNSKLFGIIANHNSKVIKYRIYETKNGLLLKKRIECQLRKYQICIQCSACDSVCPNGAISTLNNNYKIDLSKCIHCLDCIAKFTGGCLMNEVLIKKEGKNEKRSLRAKI